MHTACVWSEKLPFAKYSVVKEPENFWAAFATNRWLTGRSSFRVAFLQSRVSRAKVGEYRARTGDLLVANQALSQLS